MRKPGPPKINPTDPDPISGPCGSIAVFFTGGTIGMRARPQDHGVVPAGESHRLFSELRQNLPGLELDPVTWADLPSPHMTPEKMYRLARDVEQALVHDHVLGAVVLHGTDVLVESAYLADLTIDTHKPVVFTGSMRFYQELGYDGIRNLLNAVKACLLPMPRETGVVLLMTDRIFSAREVVKVNSLNIDAFEAPGAGPVAYVAGEEVVLTRTPSRSGPSGPEKLKPEALELQVPLIACYTGMDGGPLWAAAKAGARGLVIEAFGAGNVPPLMVPAIEDLIRQKIPVVVTTRCLDGGVWPIYAYPGGAADLKKKGALLAGRLSGPKARLLLMLILGQTRDPDQIRAWFEGHI